jgi:hypothetical protein
LVSNLCSTVRTHIRVRKGFPPTHRRSTGDAPGVEQLGRIARFRADDVEEHGGELPVGVELTTVEAEPTGEQGAAGAEDHRALVDPHPVEQAEIGELAGEVASTDHPDVPPRRGLDEAGCRSARSPAKNSTPSTGSRSRWVTTQVGCEYGQTNGWPSLVRSRRTHSKVFAPQTIEPTPAKNRSKWSSGADSSSAPAVDPGAAPPGVVKSQVRLSSSSAMYPSRLVAVQ